MHQKKIKELLDRKAEEYNQPSFIAFDPVAVPHLYNKKQDREIAGFFAAIFAWGNRTTIINKSKELMQLMDHAPHAFCLQHSNKDLQSLLSFKHRTFNATDLLYFIEFFKTHYSRFDTLESAFTMHGDTIESMLTGFHHYFFSLEHIPERTRKHIASPAKGSACKRLNMFLRWMVRKDQHGVDFGIWKNISPSKLICPIDLHVARVARILGLLKPAGNKEQNPGWETAIALTDYLRTLDSEDPVKYDFALFGLGAMNKKVITLY